MALYTDTQKNIILETALLRYVIAPDGRVVEARNKLKNKCCLLFPQSTYFAKLYHEPAYLERDIHADPGRNYLYYVGPLIPTGAQEILPQAAAFADEILTLTFPTGQVSMQLSIVHDAIVFEMLDELPADSYSMTFMNTALDFDCHDPNGFCAVVYAMNIKAKPHFYPAPVEKNLRAEVFRKIGCKGAKVAILATKIKDLRSAMQRLNTCVDPREMTLSDKGGPHAADHEASFGSYSIISDIEKIEDLPLLCEKFRKLGIRQIDFHQGIAFRQGDFHFSEKYQGQASGFRSLITEPLKREGFISGFHTYAHFIAVNCDHYTANPWAQKQLHTQENLTLSQDINADCDVLPTLEDTTAINTITGFRVKSSLYLLVDEEIIKFNQVNDHGFSAVERGVCATKAVPHRKGASVRHLSHMFGYFMPQIGSELFYEIARNTAQTYNEGGFGMIYLDALDGLSMFEPEFGWYYAASFVLEILRHCQITPILEYSTMYPLLWYCRSRGGAWDRAQNGYKRFVQEHVLFNQNMPHMYLLPTTLGWFNFCPVAFNEETPARQRPILFLDDVDYVGARAIAYNQSIVYQSIDDKFLRKVPRMVMNIERYAQYEKLRITKYFPESVTVKLQDPAKEYTLVEDKGTYHFAETHFEKAKIYMNDQDRNTLRGVNPFGRQSPLIRIENLYTAGEGPSIELQERDINQPIEAYPNDVPFDPPLDLSRNQALLIRVRGNGSDDALLLELRHPLYRSSSKAYFEVKLNFQGERTFILAEIDNGQFAESRYAKDGYAYAPTRDSMGVVDDTIISGIRLFRHGSCAGAGLSTIKAVPCVSTSIVDPSISDGDHTLVFKCVLKSGEHIEYPPAGKAVIYDYYGYARAVDAVIGERFSLEQGYSLHLGCSSCHDKARALLTTGLISDDRIE